MAIRDGMVRILDEASYGLGTAAVQTISCLLSIEVEACTEISSITNLRRIQRIRRPFFMAAMPAAGATPSAQRVGDEARSSTNHRRNHRHNSGPNHRRQIGPARGDQRQIGIASQLAILTAAQNADHLAGSLVFPRGFEAKRSVCKSAIIGSTPIGASFAGSRQGLPAMLIS
jgi:hypothetical protein